MLWVATWSAIIVDDAVEPTDEHSALFVEYRPLLFTIAYEILGSAADSDDVLQDSYIRWASINLTEVANPKAYLAKVVTRQALNAARSESRRRETYVGPWLPEPILLDEHDPFADVVLTESVSTAMLVVLQSLAPDERAVFVLREVFGFTHDEIAEIVEKSTAAVRQTAHRARRHVQSRRPRFTSDVGSGAAEATAAFLTAATTGDVEALLQVLAPDVVFTADSDGKASASRRPICGADAVARFVVGLGRIGMRRRLAVDYIAVNGMPGLIMEMTDDPGAVLWCDVADGQIQHIYVMRNPEKLAKLTTPRAIARN